MKLKCSFIKDDGDKKVRCKNVPKREIFQPVNKTFCRIGIIYIFINNLGKKI